MRMGNRGWLKEWELVECGRECGSRRFLAQARGRLSSALYTSLSGPIFDLTTVAGPERGVAGAFLVVDQARVDWIHRASLVLGRQLTTCFFSSPARRAVRTP